MKSFPLLNVEPSTLHRMAVPSACASHEVCPPRGCPEEEMVNTWLPVGLKMAEITGALCSILGLAIGEPAGVPARSSACHNHTNCPDTVSSRLPLGLNTRRFTGALWSMG